MVWFVCWHFSHLCSKHFHSQNNPSTSGKNCYETLLKLRGAVQTKIPTRLITMSHILILYVAVIRIRIKISTQFGISIFIVLHHQLSQFKFTIRSKHAKLRSLSDELKNIDEKQLLGRQLQPSPKLEQGAVHKFRHLGPGGVGVAEQMMKDNGIV